MRKANQSMAHNSFKACDQIDEQGDRDRLVVNSDESEKSKKNKLCLDFSYRTLSAFPSSEDVLSHHLQFLYLQGNILDKLPTEFFYNFPFLRHLDLRQNQLTDIPVSIAGHNSLEVLLLQDNQLTSLPCELGQVPRLRKLQFSRNPLRWPPVTILSSGLETILSFLRGTFMQQLSREDMDVAPKANDYGVKECTKEEEDNKMKLLNTTFSKILEREQPFVRFRPADSSSHENNPEIESQKQISKKGTSGLIYLKGSPKQMRHCTSSTVVSSEQLKHQKSPSLRPYVSPGHAQAIMKGQPFPLGYKKRTGLSTTKIYKTLMQQLWLNQLKCVLQSQDHALQKQKNLEVLRQWRQDAEALQKIGFPQNWTGLEFPYDFDSNYLKMVTRADRQMFQNESLDKKGHSKPNNLSCVRAMGLQEKINQILRSYDEMKSSSLATSHTNNNNTDPLSRCKLLAEEMKRVSNVQKAVQALRLSSE